jgi:hypothetical protein
MAWIYSLSAECGPDKGQAELFADHFEGLSFELVTGNTSVCSVGVHPDGENNWWAGVFPSNITRSDGSGLRDAIEISEVGFRLYKHLESAPRFRFALFGCEVEEFRLYSRLADDVAIYRDGRTEFNNHPAFSGLVLSTEIWEGLGKPTAFFPFGDNYRWRLYGGKEHSVISDQEEHGKLLRRLRDELYPRFTPPDNDT